MNTLKRIEIFRAGTHTDAHGCTLTFSAADLRDIAESYDPKLHDAPIVVGHPQMDAPAYGWVKSLLVNGDTLEAEVDQIDPEFADSVRQGRYRKCSAAFYGPSAPNNPRPGKYYLRHVGLLGAHPPAVKGLRRIEFGDDDDVIRIEINGLNKMQNETPYHRLYRAVKHALYGDMQGAELDCAPEEVGCNTAVETVAAQTKATADQTAPAVLAANETRKGNEEEKVAEERLKRLEAENAALTEKLKALEAEE